MNWVPLCVYCILLAIGIPWYWPSEDTTIWLGMPAWTISAIAVSTIASIYTAYLLTKPWDTEVPANDSQTHE